MPIHTSHIYAIEKGGRFDSSFALANEGKDARSQSKI